MDENFEILKLEVCLVHLQAGEQADKDEPEPEKDVDLLVDDVEGEDAEAVVLLHGAGGAELVERALGHLGEHPGGGV